MLERRQPAFYEAYKATMSEMTNDIALGQRARKLNEAEVRTNLPEEGLATKKKIWQSSFNIVSDAILILNHDQSLLYANKTSEEFYKLPATEMTGKYCHEILRCKTKRGQECPCMLAKGSHSREEIELQMDDEWLQVTVDPILDARGRYTGAAHIARKITEQKQAEKSLREIEQKFRILAENPIVGLFITQERRIIYANNRFAEMHGYREEDIIGQPFDILLQPEDMDALISEMDELMTMGEDFKKRLEMLRVKKNGETFWGGAMMTRGIYNGKPAVMGSIIDISESKRAEEELRKSEEQYKEIVEGTDDLIIKVDHNGHIVFANYMASKIFGLSQDDIIDMHISKCIHPDDKDYTRRLIDDAVANQAASTTFENRQISQKGEIRHLSWTSNFHYDSLGNLIDVASIARDITRRRKMEEELRMAHDDLEQRVRKRTLELEEANEALHEKTKNLEDVNTALRVLLEKREIDKQEDGERILLNVKELLVPYVNELKNGPLTENQKNYIELLESGLQEIISPFAQRITSRYMHITPRQLQVANLVKEGKTSKEIAEALNTTERTVVAHRANLRKKLGLKKKANLRTHLLSLQ